MRFSASEGAGDLALVIVGHAQCNQEYLPAAMAEVAGGCLPVDLSDAHVDQCEVPYQ